eukprot:3144055-Amphidinium_carterae.1
MTCDACSRVYIHVCTYKRKSLTTNTPPWGRWCERNSFSSGVAHHSDICKSIGGIGLIIELRIQSGYTGKGKGKYTSKRFWMPLRMTCVAPESSNA